jgi:transposase
MALPRRNLSPEEHDALETLAHARTAAARLVERARLLLRAHQGPRVPAMAPQLHLTAITVRTWLKRCTATGLAALPDTPRSGRPATDTPAQVAAVIATALTPPEHLGLPLASWTLDRLEAYWKEQNGRAMNRRRMDERLRAAGRRWRTHATWVGARVAPECAHKRGGLQNAPRAPRPVVS